MPEVPPAEQADVGYRARAGGPPRRSRGGSGRAEPVVRPDDDRIVRAVGVAEALTAGLAVGMPPFAVPVPADVAAAVLASATRAALFGVALPGTPRTPSSAPCRWRKRDVEVDAVRKSPWRSPPGRRRRGPRLPAESPNEPAFVPRRPCSTTPARPFASKDRRRGRSSPSSCRSLVVVVPFVVDPALGWESRVSANTAIAATSAAARMAAPAPSQTRRFPPSPPPFRRLTPAVAAGALDGDRDLRRLGQLPGVRVARHRCRDQRRLCGRSRPSSLAASARAAAPGGAASPSACPTSPRLA